MGNALLKLSLPALQWLLRAVISAYFVSILRLNSFITTALKGILILCLVFFAGWTGGGGKGGGGESGGGGGGGSKVFTLTVTKNGAGTGTVTSKVAGISCGSTCSYGFESGQNVELTAIPDVGSIIIRWNGDCTKGIDLSIGITMNGDKSCTAFFENPTNSGSPKSITVTIGPSGIGTTTVTDTNPTTITISAPSTPIDGTRLDIPAGALGEGAETITISYSTALPAPLGRSSQNFGLRAASATLNLSKATDALFFIPVTVSVPYNKASLANSDVPVVFYYDPSTQEYDAMQTVNIDQTGGTISFLTRHFSSYTALVIPNILQSLQNRTHNTFGQPRWLGNGGPWSGFAHIDFNGVSRPGPTHLNVWIPTQIITPTAKMSDLVVVVSSKNRSDPEPYVLNLGYEGYLRVSNQVTIRESGCTYLGNNKFQITASGTATEFQGDSLIAGGIGYPRGTGTLSCQNWSGEFPQNGIDLNGCYPSDNDPPSTQWNLQYSFPFADADGDFDSDSDSDKDSDVGTLSTYSTLTVSTLLSSNSTAVSCVKP
jgi:hypothetical protein